MASQPPVHVIIGGASGMGLATAQNLLSKGAQVAVCDIAEGALDRFYNDLPMDQKENCIHGPVNVTDRSAVQAFLQRTKAHFGKIDGIGNFAGTPGHHLSTEAIWQTAQDEYNFIMDLNVKGLFNVLSISLKPGFLEDGASLVHIGSMFSTRGFKNGAVFAASKHAAVGMVRSAAMETNGRVRVNCVLPGVIDTPMHRANLERVRGFTATPLTPIPREGQAQEIANVVIFLLGKDSSFVTGDTWNVDGGANA